MKTCALILSLASAALIIGAALTVAAWMCSVDSDVVKRLGTPGQPTSAKDPTNDPHGPDVDYALKVQGERNTNHPRYPFWTPARGDRIEQLMTTGGLSPAHLETYARQAVAFQLEVRGPVSRGDPVPVRLRRDVHLGLTTQFRLEFTEQYKLHGTINAPGRAGVIAQEIRAYSSGCSYWFDLPVDATAQAQLSDGPQYITGILDLSILDPETKPAKLLAKSQVKLFASYNQWPGNQAAKQMTYGEPERQMLASGVTIKSLSIGKWRPNEGTLELNPTAIPRGIKCSLWMRSGGHEWEIVNNLELVPRSGITIVSFNPVECEGSTLDVILRPAYVNELYQYDVYPKNVDALQVVFPDVPIDRGTGR